jgi:hypothetical protein
VSAHDQVSQSRSGSFGCLLAFATLVGCGVLFLSIVFVGIFWQDLTRWLLPVKYGYKLSVEVEAGGKRYAASATYRCEYRGESDRTSEHFYSVEGEALAIKLDDGRVLLAPLISDIGCALDRDRSWNWDKLGGRLGALDAVNRAILARSTHDILADGRLRLLYVLDRADEPTTLQYVPMPAPEIALGEGAQVTRFERTAIPAATATGGLSEHLPWIKGKTPRQIRLENRWVHWFVQSFDYADGASEIEGQGVPLASQPADRYEDVTRFFMTGETTSSPRAEIEERRRRVASRTRILQHSTSTDLRRIAIADTAAPRQVRGGFTLEISHRLSAVPWAEPERQNESSKSVRTWDPQFCIAGGGCFRLARAFYGQGYHVSLDHRLHKISGTRYVLDRETKKVFGIRLDSVTNLDLVRDHSEK